MDFRPGSVLPEPDDFYRQMDTSHDLERIRAHEGRLFGLCRDFAHGEMVGSHRHAHGQLLFAADGMLLAQTPHQLWAVPPGGVLWLPPQVPHHFETRGETRVRTLYLTPGLAKPLPCRPVVLKVSPLARELLLRAAASASEPMPGPLTGRMVNLLIDELTASTGESRGSPAGSATAAPIAGLTMPRSRGAVAFARFVMAHPDMPGPIHELAMRFGMSARTLTRHMVRETGLTPDGWRQRVRLLLALSLLQRGEPVARVASDLGYASPSSFGTAFRRAFGTTPGKVRRGC